MDRSTGGPVTVGQSYIVGERRPELFVPLTDGRIVSVRELRLWMVAWWLRRVRRLRRG